MRVTFTQDQVLDRCAQIVELADKIRGADAELRRRSFDPGRGWPTGSGPGGGSGAGPSIMVENEQGDLERVSVTGVEMTALAADPIVDAKHKLWLQLDTAYRALVSAAKNKLWHELDTADRALAEAWNAYEEATRKLKAPPVPTPVDEIWCTSCARFNLFEPRGNPKEIGATSTLCAFCHRYAKTHGELPPERLCDLTSQGVVITSRIFAEVEAAQRRDARAAKKKKKRARK